MAAMIVCGISAGIASNPALRPPPPTLRPSLQLIKIMVANLKGNIIPRGIEFPSSVYLTYEYMGEGIYVYPAESYFEYEVTVSGLYDGFECSASMSPDEGYYIETGSPAR